MSETLDIRSAPRSKIDPEEATIDLCNKFEQVKSMHGGIGIFDADLFEMKLPYLIMPFGDNQNEKLVDLWVQLISNTRISDIDVVISKRGLAVKLTQVCSNNMALFKPRVLRRPFNDKKEKRLYGKNDTYTTACKNTVKLLKGELSDTCSLPLTIAIMIVVTNSIQTIVEIVVTTSPPLKP